MHKGNQDNQVHIWTLVHGLSAQKGFPSVSIKIILLLPRLQSMALEHNMHFGCNSSDMAGVGAVRKACCTLGILPCRDL